MWNTDQGSQFTSPQLTSVLEHAGVQISMDGRGRAYDNSFTERFWRSLKYENIYPSDDDSPRAARQGIATSMAFYTTERPHQGSRSHVPNDVVSVIACHEMRSHSLIVSQRDTRVNR